MRPYLQLFTDVIFSYSHEIKLVNILGIIYKTYGFVQ